LYFISRFELSLAVEKCLIVLWFVGTERIVIEAVNNQIVSLQVEDLQDIQL